MKKNLEQGTESSGGSENEDEEQGISTLNENENTTTTNSSTSDQIRIIEKTKDKFQKRRIFFKQYQSSDKFKISVLQTDGETTVYFLEQGLFQAEITALRMYTSHEFHNKSDMMQRGTYGNIFDVQYEGIHYAVKFVQTRKTNEKKISKILKEVFYSKIISCLSIGPQFQSIYGYDCLIFDDGIEFTMEKCTTDFTVDQIQTQMKENWLKTSLQTLHLLQICHCDIKTDNIAWSDKKNKMIFLDFGLTRFVKQKKDQKTLTGFLGTVRYVCPQMKKIIFLKSKAKVNLFQNDLYSIKIVLKELIFFKQSRKQTIGCRNNLNFQPKTIQILQQNQNTCKFPQKDLNPQQIRLFQSSVQFFRFRYYLFRKQYEKIEKILIGKKFEQLAAAYSFILLDQWTNMKSNSDKKFLFSFYQKYLKSEKIQSQAFKNFSINKYISNRHSINEISEISNKIKSFAQQIEISRVGEFWGVWEWMGPILKFIVPSEQGVQKDSERTKIVSDLYYKLTTRRQTQQIEERNIFKKARFVFNQFLIYYLNQTKDHPSKSTEAHTYINLLKSCFIIIGDFERNEFIELQMLEYLSYDPKVKMKHILDFAVQKALIYEKQTFFLTFNINYECQIQRMEIGPNDFQLKKIQEDYIFKIKYLEYLMKGDNQNEPFVNLFESHPIEEFQEMYELYRSKKVRNKFQYFRQATKLPFFINYCNLSRSVKACFFAAKVFQVNQGTQNFEKLKSKQPLLRLYDFVQCPANMQFLQQKQLAEFYFEIERPEYLALCPAKIMLFQRYLPKEQFLNFLIDYFNFFKKELLMKYSFSKIEAVSRMILQTIKIIQYLPRPLISEKPISKQNDLIQIWKSIMNSIFQKGVGIAKYFQGNIFCLCGQSYEALVFFMAEYWCTNDDDLKIALLDNIVLLRKYLDKRTISQFSEIICHFRSRHPRISSNLMGQFLNYLVSTVEAYCIKKKYSEAFNHLILSFQEINARGRTRVCMQMGQIINFFCSMTPTEEMFKIIRQSVLNQRLEKIEKSLNFFFAFFYYVFGRVSFSLTNEETKRFLILSVFGRSKFEGDLSFKVETFYRKQFIKFFPILKQRRKKILMGFYLLETKNMYKWEQFSKKSINKMVANRIRYKINKLKKNLQNEEMISKAGTFAMK